MCYLALVQNANRLGIRIFCLTKAALIAIRHDLDNQISILWFVISKSDNPLRKLDHSVFIQTADQVIDFEWRNIRTV